MIDEAQALHATRPNLGPFGLWGRWTMLATSATANWEEDLSTDYTDHTDNVGKFAGQV